MKTAALAVLHGSSGVSDHDLSAAARAGTAKVNIATHLNELFTRTVRDHLAADDTVDPRRYLGPTRAVIGPEVARLLRLLRGVPAPGAPAIEPAPAYVTSQP